MRRSTRSQTKQSASEASGSNAASSDIEAGGVGQSGKNAEHMLHHKKRRTSENFGVDDEITNNNNSAANTKQWRLSEENKHASSDAIEGTLHNPICILDSPVRSPASSSLPNGELSPIQSPTRTNSLLASPHTPKNQILRIADGNFIHNNNNNNHNHRNTSRTAEATHNSGRVHINDISAPVLLTILSYVGEMNLWSASLVCSSWWEIIKTGTYLYNSVKLTEDSTSLTSINMHNSFSNINLNYTLFLQRNQIVTTIPTISPSKQRPRPSRVTDDVLMQLAVQPRFERIKELSLLKCRSISNSSLEAVAKKCIHLQSLTLDECCRIGDAALRTVFEHCPNLQRLSLSNMPNLTNDCMQYLAEFFGDATTASSSPVKRNFTTLRMKENIQLTNKCLESIAQISTLTGLFLTNFPAITDEGVKHLHALTQLQEISLEGCGDTTVVGPNPHGAGNIFTRTITKDGLLKGPFIQKPSQSMKSVTMYFMNNIANESVSEVSMRCPNLTKLHLVGLVHLHDVGVRAIAMNCPHLKDFSLRLCLNVTNDGIKAFAEHGSIQRRVLERVDLSSMEQLEDDAIVHLASASGDTLRRLKINDCRKLSDSALIVLGNKCPNLTKLDLQGLPKITDLGVKELSKGCRNLRTLRLSTNTLSDISVYSISKYCSSLTGLVLANTANLSDESLRFIGKHLGASLRKLVLDGCIKFSDAGLIELSRGCSALEMLTLKGLYIRNEGIKALCANCPSLQRLVLCHCWNLVMSYISPSKSNNNNNNNASLHYQRLTKSTGGATQASKAAARKKKMMGKRKRPLSMGGGGGAAAAAAAASGVETATGATGSSESAPSSTSSSPPPLFALPSSSASSSSSSSDVELTPSSDAIVEPPAQEVNATTATTTSTNNTTNTNTNTTQRTLRPRRGKK